MPRLYPMLLALLIALSTGAWAASPLRQIDSPPVFENHLDTTPVAVTLNLSLEQIPIRVSLALPDGNAWHFVTLNSGPGPRGRVLWQGHIESSGTELLSTLLIDAQGIFGTLQTSQGRYRLYPEQGRQWLQKLDQQHQPEIDQDPSEQGQAPSTSPLRQPWYQAAAHKAEIRVLLSYSAQARQQMGSLEALNNALDIALAETNASFINQGLGETIELVEAGRIQVAAADTATLTSTLDRLKSNTGNVYADLYQARQLNQADIVVHIASATDFCGYAGAVLADFARAFATVSASCLNDATVFAHEIGHLLGARHNREEDSAFLPFIFGHGYGIDQDSAPVRTIMSYRSACQNHECTRLAVWSDPELLIGGWPAGNSNYANNRRVLGETAAALGQLYENEGGPPVLTLTSPSDGANLLQNQPVSLIATAQDAVDGDVSASIVWISDIDGPLSSPAYLSLGQHMLTASITDSDGFTTTRNLRVQVYDRAADLAIQLKGNDGKWRNNRIALQALVSNRGPSAVDNASLILTFPASVSYASHLLHGPGSCSLNDHQLDCDLNTLLPGEEHRLDLAVSTSDAKTRFLFSADISGDDPDPKPSNNTTSQKYGGAIGWVLVPLALLLCRRLQRRKIS